MKASPARSSRRSGACSSPTASGCRSANKLKMLSAEEVAHKQLIVEGIMAIQAGVSPRVVEELLKSHVPPSERDAADAPPATSSGGGPAASRSCVAGGDTCRTEATTSSTKSTKST